MSERMKRMKMTIVAGATCVVALTLWAGCGKQQGHDSEVKQTSLSKKQTAPFVPSTDSAISRAQMTAWFACNRPLDSLSALFTASLAENKNALPDSVFNRFSSSQDIICVEKGLSGGYAEYKWILENVGSTKNKALYDSIKTESKR
jgi:hypothetical protein